MTVTDSMTEFVFNKVRAFTINSSDGVSNGVPF